MLGLPALGPVAIVDSMTVFSISFAKLPQCHMWHLLFLADILNEFLWIVHRRCPTLSTFLSDPYRGPMLLPFHRHPLVWNCSCHCQMLLFDGGSLLNCCHKAHLIVTTNHTLQTAENKMLSAPLLPFSTVVPLHDREINSACAQSTKLSQLLVCLVS